MSIFSILWSRLSQDSTNLKITSVNYIVITPRLSQNKRNMDFGMLVTATSVDAMQVFFALVLLCIAL